MKFFKSHFLYSKRQRNGIFFLLLIIVGLQIMYVFEDFSLEDEEINTAEIDSFKKQLDSLYVAKIESKRPNIFPFNPSFLTDFKGVQLGMSTQEIDRVVQHRTAGKYINSDAKFQEISKISDSLLAVISPYFKFPDWVLQEKVPINKVAIGKKQTKSKGVIIKRNLNQVSADGLISIYGVGKVLANRIVKYRTSIKGFMFNDQLADVYGLKPEVAERILLKYTVLEKPTIKKVNVNIATFKEVLHLPYIDYELTKRIFNYRDEVAEIQSLEELKNIEGFPLDLFDRIAVYLDAK
jgi:DNA uptake protein ComE-like DNA-binding protein